MNIWIILLALQVVATVFSLVRESAVVREAGKGERFEGEKLDFRS